VQFADQKKLRAVPFHRALVALFSVFQLFQLKEKKGNIFFTKKNRKKESLSVKEGGKGCQVFY